MLKLSEDIVSMYTRDRRERLTDLKGNNNKKNWGQVEF